MIPKLFWKSNENFFLDYLKMILLDTSGSEYNSIDLFRKGNFTFDVTHLFWNIQTGHGNWPIYQNLEGKHILVRIHDKSGNGICCFDLSWLQGIMAGIIVQFCLIDLLWPDNLHISETAILGLISNFDWAWSRPMREGVRYVMSFLIGWDLALT